MGGYFIGDDALFDIVLIGQTQMFFGRDIAQHGTPEPADHGRSDAGGNVVVAGSDIGGQRSQGVKRRLVTHLELFLHIDLDQV